MRLALLAAASALVLLAAAPALAGHCTTYSTTQPDVDTDPTGLAPARVYLDYESEPYWGFPWDVLIGTWGYVESNGIAGLQRGDEKKDDTCHRMIQPDTLLY